MILLKNEKLANYSFMKIGGPARFMLIPESRNELIEVIASCKTSKLPHFILGRGSNLLIDDKGYEGIVINNRRSCHGLKYDRYVYAGSSVHLQTFVRFCVDQGLYGSEYLYSIPGNIGGAIFMNAGRGKEHNLFISNYLKHVEVFDGLKVFRISKNKCKFSYRKSIFHERKDWVILSAVFDLPKQKKEVGLNKIKERMQYIKNVQDLGYPNLGSVFKENFGHFKELQGIQYGNAQFSDRKSNWIVNLDNAKFKDVLKLIEHAKNLHNEKGMKIPLVEWVIIGDDRINIE